MTDGIKFNQKDIFPLPQQHFAIPHRNGHITAEESLTHMGESIDSFINRNTPTL